MLLQAALCFVGEVRVGNHVHQPLHAEKKIFLKQLPYIALANLQNKAVTRLGGRSKNSFVVYHALPTKGMVVVANK